MLWSSHHGRYSSLRGSYTVTVCRIHSNRRMWSTKVIFTSNIYHVNTYNKHLSHQTSIESDMNHIKHLLHQTSISSNIYQESGMLSVKRLAWITSTAITVILIISTSITSSSVTSIFTTFNIYINCPYSVVTTSNPIMHISHQQFYHHYLLFQISMISTSITSISIIFNISIKCPHSVVTTSIHITHISHQQFYHHHLTFSQQLRYFTLRLHITTYEFRANPI